LQQLRIGPVITQTSGVGFTLVVTAYDGTGSVLTNYSGQAVLTDSSGTIQPTAFSKWVNGVARPQVTINVTQPFTQPFNGDVITVTSLGISRSSNLFNVVLNPAGTLLLNVNPATLRVGHSAFVTATVLDGSGNLVGSGVSVTFTAALGTVAPQAATTVNGKVYAVFTGTANGTAVITATIASGGLGTATVEVSQNYNIYLPMVMRDFQPGKNLIVTNIVVSPGNPAATQVVIQNIGDRAVTEAFDIELYMDPPNPSNIKINKFWYDIGCPYGVTWEVNTWVMPGQLVTLTLLPGDPYLAGGAYTKWPASFSAGSHNLWAQVDAWGSTGTAGLVPETNESDNIRGPITFVVP
jgi:hypothetical protein